MKGDKIFFEILPAYPPTEHEIMEDLKYRDVHIHTNFNSTPRTGFSGKCKVQNDYRSCNYLNSLSPEELVDRRMLVKIVQVSVYIIVYYLY